MTAVSTLAAPRAVYGRMARNIAWLLGGKGFSGVTSLCYLALAARDLGPAGFGGFALVLAYAEAIANLMQFQSWQAVIRYGAEHLHARNPTRLTQLLGLTATVDWAGAMLGTILAVAGIAIFAPLLGWAEQERGYAAMLGMVLLFSVSATPSGMLRLTDRFDLLAYGQAATPGIRLVGSVIAWSVHGGIGAFVLVWAAAAIAQCGATWALALAATGFRPRFAPHDLMRAARENPGVARFLVATNLTASLSLLWDQMGTLAVGGTAGAAAAGGFRIASRLANAIATPASLLSRVLFPELSRLAARGDDATLRHVIARVTAFSMAMSLVIVAVAWFGGDMLLTIIGGRAFGFVHELLLLMALAAAINLTGLALEPWLTAHGEAGKVLAIRLVATLVYAGLLAVLLGPYGPAGAAVAAIGGTITLRLLLSLAASRLWRTPRRDRS